MAGWSMALGGDSPSCGNPLAVVMVITFPMWSTGWPTELSLITPPVVSKIGSLSFANTYAATIVAQEVR